MFDALLWMNKDDLISRSEFCFSSYTQMDIAYGRSCNMQSQHMQFIYTGTSEGVNGPTNDKTHMHTNANTNKIKSPTDKQTKLITKTDYLSAVDTKRWILVLNMYSCSTAGAIKCEIQYKPFHNVIW